MRLDFEAFSYLSDPSVPGFSDTGPRTVMDAHCGLCSRGALWITRYDKRDEFRIIPLQSELGVALMRHYGLDPDDPLSWLYIEEGRAYTSLDAFIRVAVRIGGVWNTMRVLRIVPVKLQDLAYGLVARNRYRWFGKTDMCNLPDAALQKRLLS